MLSYFLGKILPNRFTGAAYLVQQNKIHNLNMSQEKMKSILDDAIRYRNTMKSFDKNQIHNSYDGYFLSYLDLEINKIKLVLESKS